MVMNTQNDEKKQTEEELIDIVGMLEDYLRTLRRMWIWVLILALLGGAVSYARSYVAWAPRYTASATFTITAGQDGHLLHRVRIVFTITRLLNRW